MKQEISYDIDICFDIALDRNKSDVYFLSLSSSEKKLARKLAHKRIKDLNFDQGNVRRPATTGRRALKTLRRSLDKLGVLDDKTEQQLRDLDQRFLIESLADHLAMSYLLETRHAWPGWGMGTWGYNWREEYARRLKERGASSR